MKWYIVRHADKEPGNSTTPSCVSMYRRWQFQVDTCGILEITYQPAYGKWKIIRVNYVCH